MLIEINSLEEIKGENYIIYKHSLTCPISSLAKTKVNDFVKQNPKIPVYMCVVQNNPLLKEAISKTYNIEHESPQAIIVSLGKVVEVEHHYGIQLISKFFE